MLYEVVYKCQQCGRRRVCGDPVEFINDESHQLIAKVCEDQVISDPPDIKVPLYATCNCGAGCVGLARFIGFRVKH